MSIDAKRRLAAAAFVVLLALSVFWPAPAIGINQLCCHAHLTVDDLSFLGREAPAWDVAFWCIAGLFLLILLQPSNDYTTSDFREIWTLVRATRIRLCKTDAIAAICAAILVAVIWRFADAPITAFAERIQSSNVEDAVRIANRFGGGMNPAMVIFFFLIAGVTYRRHRWVAYGVAMALAGAAAGVSVQIVKYTIGRTRPELWLGPFHHARAAATSFPSGHTVGAFALAGVLMLASPSRTMRVVAFLLALSVAVSRVMAFRHWTSDVLASAAIGIILAAIAVRVVFPSADYADGDR
ncbi:MAG: phosphatase PAP2 family protein [Acidobacteria bacterium]|nr:phosphatase PAP2 family protein [Acidobacteriota bacterium]MBV9068640.1 phosphatase PAP2 family protein [Acidobacteriota bacterium]MBV9187093.1 phosphatase PAP2 family protein [Acidobacteriota bacterium]